MSAGFDRPTSPRDAWLAIQTDHLAVATGSPVNQRLLGDQEQHVPIGQHELQPGRRVIGVQRQVSATRLENPQDPNDQFSRPLQAQSHQRLRADPQRPQVMGQLIGPLVQFAIAQLLVTTHYSHRIGGACDLLLEQLVHAAVSRIIDRRVVPLDQQLSPFALTQQRQLAQSLIRISDNRFQQRHKVTRQPLDRLRIEQIGGVDHFAAKLLARRPQVHLQVKPHPLAARRLTDELQIGYAKSCSEKLSSWNSTCTSGLRLSSRSGCSSSTSRSKGRS